MTTSLTVLEIVGPWKLVPFFITCIIFFVLFANTPASETSTPWFYCIVKCLPIISLMLFVLLHFITTTVNNSYSWHILIGLIFSCLGDAFLVWEKYFKLGAVCFSISQICYLMAFGWTPFDPYVAIVVFGVGYLGYSYLSTSLHGVIRYMVAAYIAVECTMTWRAVARVQFSDDLASQWTKLSACLGSIAFVISDLKLAIDMFKGPIPYAHVGIMVTYYAAQFGIALSVVESKAG
ncbi:hypothetical protein DPMN_013913 [Dreissena polymorpha]|uniref:lysoplasmalogenase n=1 Tax=Dreissena polymorpha TaxID=45954 RepID=A0A9D4N525_DREPO|nr:hypothetical protein DPMN_013913 [Dreissena polymorpha]